ncbi:MAG: hypothetical protein ACJASQ_000725 [Crocinitomicaceae bacterium]|jgi:hypothetical protein
MRLVKKEPITRPTHKAELFLLENHFWINKSIPTFEKTTLKPALCVAAKRYKSLNSQM